MIRSMTAFANEKSEIDGWLISWEIRSVNHRFLDLSLRLPEGFRFLEPEIRASTAKILTRGKVEYTLLCKKNEMESTNLCINHRAIKQLLSSVDEIEGILTNPKAYSALEVLAWPGIVGESEPDGKQLSTHILKLLEVALQNLVSAREREGQQLAHLIKERCTLLKSQVLSARERVPVVLQSIREKILSRLAEISSSPDPDRLEQEMVYFAQKLDVDEELDRLDSHIDEIRKALKRQAPIGRRLDFLMQELNREANTLGSKSADTITTQISVEMKVLIEQMREQVQNIE